MDWYDSYETQLVTASQTDLEMVILGDFNLDFVKSEKYKKWNNLYMCYNLTQLIDVPTRVTGTSDTIIDHIYVTSCVKVKEHAVGNIVLSDHYPVSLTLSRTKSSPNHSHNTIQYRKVSSIPDEILLSNV